MSFMPKRRFFAEAPLFDMSGGVVIESAVRFGQTKRGEKPMYQHIGKKLRVLAYVVCVVGILGSLAAAVLLYLGKTLDLRYCILIGVGGAVVSLLTSWGIYAVGDIHVKLERLEDKLIPKPNYMSYLNQNQALRGKCEICGTTTDLVNAKIVDHLGTRFRKVCKECYAANNCTPAE